MAELDQSLWWKDQINGTAKSTERARCWVKIPRCGYFCSKSGTWFTTIRYYRLIVALPVNDKTLSSDGVDVKKIY